MALRRFEALEQCYDTLQRKDLPLTEVSAALNLLEGESPNMAQNQSL